MERKHKVILTPAQRIMLKHGALMIVALQKGEPIHMAPRHIHRYSLVRKTTAIVNGKLVTYLFYKCQNPGCPQPDTMEVKNA